MQQQRCPYDAYASYTQRQSYPMRYHAGYAQQHLGHHHFSCSYDAHSIAMMRSGEASAQSAARGINLSA